MRTSITIILCFFCFLFGAILAQRAVWRKADPSKIAEYQALLKEKQTIEQTIIKVRQSEDY